MIRLEGVCVTTRGGREVHVLDGVCMSLEPGRVALISGDIGAGKTTLLSLLYGARTADRGTVEVLGRDVGRLRASSVALLRRRVGVVAQRPALIDDRSALANVAIALEIAGVGRRVARARAAQALGTVGLACEIDALAEELSAGERQRVAIARAIAIEPAVFIADEPTAHLDWATPFVRLIDQLQAVGTTVVIASNDPRLWNAAAARGWCRADLSGGALHDVIAAADVSGRPTAGHSDGAEPNVVPFPVSAGHA